MVTKASRPRHYGSCKNNMNSINAYNFIDKNSDTVYYTTGNSTPFNAKASVCIKGPHKREKVIRFFTRGTEKGRAYSCCWGKTTNCNRTYTDCFTGAL